LFPTLVHTALQGHLALHLTVRTGLPALLGLLGLLAQGSPALLAQVVPLALQVMALPALPGQAVLQVTGHQAPPAHLELQEPGRAALQGLQVQVRKGVLGLPAPLVQVVLVNLEAVEHRAQAERGKLVAPAHQGQAALQGRGVAGQVGHPARTAHLGLQGQAVALAQAEPVSLGVAVALGLQVQVVRDRLERVGHLVQLGLRQLGLHFLVRERLFLPGCMDM